MVPLTMAALDEVLKMSPLIMRTELGTRVPPTPIANDFEFDN